MEKKIEATVVEAFDRSFVKGNIPEITEIRCIGCGNCVTMCKKLGPDALEIVDGVAKVVRPESCIGDGACMITCPTKAIFCLSNHDSNNPPKAL